MKVYKRLVSMVLVSVTTISFLITPSAFAASRTLKTVSGSKSVASVKTVSGSKTVQPYFTGYTTTAAKSSVRRTKAPAPVVVSAPAAPAVASRWMGFYVPSVPNEIAPLDTLESKIGTTAAVVNFFVDDVGAFPVGRATNAVNNGSIPMITLEFWSAANGVDSITNGSKDAFLKSYAQAAKSFGHTVYLRPFHEMNGNWYPWNGTVNGNSAAKTVAAWKHVKDIFAAQGATNVKFVWCVNNDSVPNTSANSVAAYWPGEAYVDIIALDGYNWGTTRDWSTWRTFAQVFGPVYGQVAALSASKPIIVAETGCAEQGGSKADWVRGMFASITTSYPRIKGVVWFNANKENDWRVESTTASLDAVKAGLATGF